MTYTGDARRIERRGEVLVYHLYPRTVNIGDHFVAAGVKGLVETHLPHARVVTFDVNRRGVEKTRFGLTRDLVEEANAVASAVLIGGSNLYEGRSRWGIEVDLGALRDLRPPLGLVGIGTGSEFMMRRPTRPTRSLQAEIAALHDAAQFVGVRDAVSVRWLGEMGVKAVLIGDPATFIERRPYQGMTGELVALVQPPGRFARKRGRTRLDRRRDSLFRILPDFAKALHASGMRPIVLCNDPRDVDMASAMFSQSGIPVEQPENVATYVEIVKRSRMVIAGRLHSAILALALGVPFMLIDVDQRTRGFQKTYELEASILKPTWVYRQKEIRKALATMETPGFQSEMIRAVDWRDALYHRALEGMGSLLHHRR